MQLKLFDILSSVIPGAFVLICLFFTSFANNFDPIWIEGKIAVYKDIASILVVCFVVTSYITGYVIHALGSWIEPLLWRTWGGRPEQLLLTNNTNRLGIGSKNIAIVEWLKKESSDERLISMKISELRTDDFRKLFQIAKNMAFVSGKSAYQSRIEDFNNSYVFSRNILVAFLFMLLCGVILCFNSNLGFGWLAIMVLLVLIVWWRARDRSIYYTREILVAGYYSHHNN